MEHRRPALPLQRYSSTSDYPFDNHHEVIQPSRTPLGESTGNVQPQNIAALALCHQGPLALSPPVQHIPTPPILPTQSVTSAYRTSLRARRSFHRDVSLRDSSMAHSRGGRNPIYAWKHFHDYRTKVAQKEREGDDPKWPMYLEDAFLDGMSTEEPCSSKGYVHGQAANSGTSNPSGTNNGEYLWICHWVLFPPGPGEIVPVGKYREKAPNRPKAHPKYRTRKQVSSHIQVLKGFFTTLPVSADSEVFLRPKTCHIYTSHSELTLSEDFRKAFTADGTCLSADAYAPDGTRLESQGDFPHLEKNSNKNTKRDVHRGGRDEPRTYLLHEYTESLTQNESSSVRDISSKWDHRFPDLRDKLMAALDDTHILARADGALCHGALRHHPHGGGSGPARNEPVPVGTILDGRAEFNISRPELANHMWRSSTCVVKPRELYLDASEPPFWDHTDTCRPSRRGNARDTIEVDFPATSWANTFCRLAKYVTAERERKQREKLERGSESKAKREGGSGSKGSKLPTPLDMLEQIAMYQEIWSAPNDGSRDPVWTRRSVVLWTFSNVRAKVEETKGKQSKEQSRVKAGTTWRFLSKLDPMSQYHQQRAYLPGTPNVSRDSIMSPDPGYQHHLGAVMHEHFGSAYDVSGLALPSHQHQQKQQHAQLTNLNMFDGFSNGLATPPPTACLPPNSYATQSGCFDTATIASTDSLQLHLSFASDGSTVAGAAADPTTDPFLSGLGVPVSAPFDDSWPATASASAADSLQGLDTPHWATTSFDGSQHHTSLGGWSMSADEMASMDSHAWTAAISHQPQHHDGSRDGTPWHEGNDTLWATQRSANQQGGLAVPSANTLHADAWATASGSTNHDQQRPWAITQQQPALLGEIGRSMSIGSVSSNGTIPCSLWDEEHLGQQLEIQQGEQQQYHHSFSSSGTPTVTIKDEEQQQSQQRHDLYTSLDPQQQDILTATRGRKRTREPEDDGSSTCSGSGRSSHSVGYGGNNNNEYDEDSSNGYAMHASMRRKPVHRPAGATGMIEDVDHHHHHQNAPLPPFMS
ncbi:Conidiophore development regulator [Apiospora phragmitis]|uniref:Conidiophore development regulator n=1 Tax=Apiospora phragmitis TaxID=2905665 RepID=A0ABR1V3K3_9PEZI